LSTADDEEILGFALGKNAVVVTHDADFHAILAVSGAVGPSVIRIRIQGLRTEAISECVRSVSRGFESELKAGSIVYRQGAEDEVPQAPDWPFPLKLGTEARLSFLIRQASS